MDADLLVTLGQIAGIGGLAIGLVLLVFRQIVAKNVFPKLKRDDAYRLLRMISTYAFVIGLAGIGAWTGISIFGPRDGAPPSISTEGDGSPIITGTDGDVSISIGAPPTSSEDGAEDQP